MRTTRQDTSSVFKDVESPVGGHPVFSEETAYNQPSKHSARFLRATAPGPLEGDVTSVESGFTDDNWVDFEDMPDLEKLLGRTNLSDLEDLPDLGELLDLQESGSAGTFLPAMKSECQSPHRLEHSKPTIRARKVSRRASRRGSIT
jgi:hypothetical protein